MFRDIFLSERSYLCHVNKSFFISLIVLLVVAASAKSQPALDTIINCLKQKPRPFVNVDSRNSFINNDLVSVFGAKAGITYGKRLSFGIGYNQLYNPPKSIKEDVQYINDLGKPYFINKGLKFYYVSATIEYTFYETKHWELNMPLQIGIGESYYQYTLNGSKIKTDRHASLVYEPTISIEYKIVKWFGIGADYGFRFMLTGNKSLNSQLSSPIVTFGLSIYYSEIYKSLFPNSKLAKQL